MSSATELAELHALIGGLRRCVTSLSSRYRDAPAVRRVVNDVQRILNDVELLDIDAGELDLARHILEEPAEKIAIPDTQYDAEFWRDADDEGVGGYGRS
ncbi:hypothetical protein [Candidatus Mycobacterium methanotrophicum]|uniref:Uncharacterized protein n=1 Tax=Candidatus Mycobacterium methanotrophicum TaxID=2943498 RepID=A0ABY4QLU0_9MYCO|nr:hypothetical protein [Candidatus Mycobacterium methanotrophicum]UQX10821.1 hypothetical protein M5I08_23180 [Candidatus Mycobacterium methanotrophicum]